MNTKERMISMKITLKPQERSGQYRFDGKIVFTRNFGNILKDKTTEVILASMSLILELARKNMADYFQVLEVETDTFKGNIWIIDSVDYVTALMPEDY